MISEAPSVEAYLASLPPNRRTAIQAVREVILKNLDAGYEEGMQYGMIGYYVPHKIYPAGYHCDAKRPVPFAGLASQKQYMAVYLMCTYEDPGQESWFKAEWEKTGKKLDMGKSCVRFKTLADLPLELIGKAIKRVPVKQFLTQYELSIKKKPGA